jgi:hypothetical protein
MCILFVSLSAYLKNKFGVLWNLSTSISLWQEMAEFWLKAQLQILTGETGKLRKKKIIQYSTSPERDLKPGPPEYEAGVLTSRRRSSVTMFLILMNNINGYSSKYYCGDKIKLDHQSIFSYSSRASFKSMWNNIYKFPVNMVMASWWMCFWSPGCIDISTLHTGFENPCYVQILSISLQCSNILHVSEKK